MSFLKKLTDKIYAPKVQIQLTLQKNEFMLGEEIKGEVQILPEEEFDVKQAFVWLTCYENAKKTRTVTEQYGNNIKQRQEEYWDQAKLYETYFGVFGTGHFPQGYRGKYPFLFKVPSVTRETFYSVDNYVKWWMYLSIQVLGRPNIQSETCEVLIAKPPPPPQQSSIITSKETIREVVLIPCTYCSGLMPQTSIFCPNCGARRKG